MTYKIVCLCGAFGFALVGAVLCVATIMAFLVWLGGTGWASSGRSHPSD